MLRASLALLLLELLLAFLLLALLLLILLRASLALRAAPSHCQAADGVQQQPLHSVELHGLRFALSFIRFGSRGPSPRPLLGFWPDQPVRGTPFRWGGCPSRGRDALPPCAPRIPEELCNQQHHLAAVNYMLGADLEGNNKSTKKPGRVSPAKGVLSSGCVFAAYPSWPRCHLKVCKRCKGAKEQRCKGAKVCKRCKGVLRQECNIRFVRNATMLHEDSHLAITLCAFASLQFDF